jgi:sugar O-acyltransferase (sialic acid O-acetyltransferase NeuD family)
MTKNLIIVSAGQYGRETLGWAIQAIEHGADFRMKGFVDDRPNILDGFDYEFKILGDVEHYQIEEDDVFVGAIGDPMEKVKFYTPILKRGGRFVNLIHPLANIGKNVQLGTGVVMAPFSSVTCDAKVGNFVSIGALSNSGHDTVIGDWSQISSHCGLNGGVTLGDGVWLGSHACLIPRIKIGDWSFIGAGSVVLRDVQPGMKMFGNPAVAVGKVDRRN